MDGIPLEIGYSVHVWKEGPQFIAHAMPLDVMSSGPSIETARTALDEAVRLFLRTTVEHGTLHEVLEEAGYRINGELCMEPDWVSVGHQTMSVIT